MPIIKRLQNRGSPYKPVNKSRIFSAGTEKCQMRESLRREWRALCKQADKADGLFSARPAGLAALNSLGVGAFRWALI